MFISSLPVNPTEMASMGPINLPTHRDQQNGPSAMTDEVQHTGSSLREKVCGNQGGGGRRWRAGNGDGSRSQEQIPGESRLGNTRTKKPGAENMGLAESIYSVKLLVGTPKLLPPPAPAER